MVVQDLTAAEITTLIELIVREIRILKENDPQSKEIGHLEVIIEKLERM